MSRQKYFNDMDDLDDWEGHVRVCNMKAMKKSKPKWHPDRDDVKGNPRVRNRKKRFLPE